MNYTKNERQERVKKYFIPTPEKLNYTKYIILISISLLMAFYGFGSSGVLGFLFAITGLAWLGSLLKKLYTVTQQYKKDYEKAEPKATDKEMDDWRNRAFDDITIEARRRLDIDIDDESSHPLIIHGPAVNSLYRPGNDRVLRFNKHDILLLFLTDHNLSTFKCVFDLGIGEILTDSTKEFPYKDITNLETSTANNIFYYKDSEKTEVEGIQVLSLFTSGGNSISVNYFFNRETHEDYVTPPSEAENTIKAIRKRLREYKDRYNNS